jgi:DNA-binding transcriptional LysR family regulator
VSQTIRRMERRIGAPLFERTSRRVALTAIGTQLRDDLEPAHRGVVDALERAASAAREVRGVLDVGFLGPTAGDFVVAAANALRVAHPDCGVALHEAHLSDPLAALRDGEVDVVLTKFPVREAGLTTGPVLLRKPRLLAVSNRLRIARQSSASPGQVAGLPFVDIAGPVPEYWRDAQLPRIVAGVPISRGPAVKTLHEVMLLVADGRGVCPVDDGVTRYLNRPDITYLPLLGWPPFESGLVWRSGGETALVRAFAQVASSFMAASAHG